MLVNQPAILPGAFAAEGDKNTIPANNDGLSGLASIAKGFPQITQVPLAQGGQPPHLGRAAERLPALRFSPSGERIPADGTDSGSRQFQGTGRRIVRGRSAAV